MKHQIYWLFRLCYFNNETISECANFFISLLKCAKFWLFCFAFYHAVIDPLGQPKVTAGRDNCFRTCCPSIRPYVRPYVRPHFSNLEKQNNRKQCMLLAWLWVWPSGSLMTLVLLLLCPYCCLVSVCNSAQDIWLNSSSPSC